MKMCNSVSATSPIPALCLAVVSSLPRQVLVFPPEWGKPLLQAAFQATGRQVDQEEEQLQQVGLDTDVCC